MCGIIGYVGSENALPKITEGLSVLEYRGYDSVGLAVQEQEQTLIVKCKGRIPDLQEKLNGKVDFSTCGIGHTRWATHGGPSDKNAHPHRQGAVVLVHNGIIENYKEIKEALEQEGYSFVSDTDSEVVAGLLDKHYKVLKNPVLAIQKAVEQLRGTYAFGILFEDRKEEVFAIRKGSPLLLAKSDKGFYLASDMTAFLAWTKEYYLLEENVLAHLTTNKASVFDGENEQEITEWKQSSFSVESAQKNGYEHYMLKEMFDEPTAIQNSLASRIGKDGLPDFSLDGLGEGFLKKVQQVQIVACGSAYHAGLVGAKLIEEIAHIPASAYLASEYRYHPPVTLNNTLVIAISQSGETADTLAALRYAKGENLPTLSIVNAPETAIAREADHCLYTHAGPEIAVATTKGYATQLSVLWLLAIGLANEKNVSDKEVLKKQTAELFMDAPKGMDYALSMREACQKIGKKLALHDDIFYIGRGNDYALSMEAALKLKEISYIHCEAYAAGELKHGTISLIEKGTPVLALSTDAELFEKMLGNIKEVGARGADVILLCREDENIPSEYQNQLVSLPSSSLPACVFALLGLVQLLAYETAKEKGCDIDKPRNLAKSVTVE